MAHGINETEVQHVITTHALLPKVKAILNHCDKVTHVIYMEDQVGHGDVCPRDKHDSVANGLLQCLDGLVAHVINCQR